VEQSVHERAAVHDGDLLLPLTSEWDTELASADPLHFPGYAGALAATPGESVRTGLAESGGTQVVLIQSDFDIFGGTMGAVAGEPHATLGFAGPRVVRQVTGEAPPAWSHTAESAYAAGLVDALVERSDQVAWVNAVLGSADWPLVNGGSGDSGGGDTGGHGSTDRHG